MSTLLIELCCVLPYVNFFVAAKSVAISLRTINWKLCFPRKPSRCKKARNISIDKTSNKPSILLDPLVHMKKELSSFHVWYSQKRDEYEPQEYKTFFYLHEFNDPSISYCVPFSLRCRLTTTGRDHSTPSPPPWTASDLASSSATTEVRFSADTSLKLKRLFQRGNDVSLLFILGILRTALL